MKRYSLPGGSEMDDDFCVHTEEEVEDNKNNGLITKVWGPPAWIFNHAVSYGYPLNPTPIQKEQYRKYFQSLGDVLPCKYCRESYHKFISEGDTKLTDNVLESRATLTKWLYNIHEAVNAKLEMSYGVTQAEVDERYESFRAKCKVANKKVQTGCIAPLDYKAFSFRKLNQIDPPIISLETAKRFYPLAKKMGFDDDVLSVFKLADNLDGDLDLLKAQSWWKIRNKLCQKVIKYMRENGINSLDDNGIPTTCELLLIMMLSSNLNKSELETAAKNIDKFKYYSDLN